MQKFLNKTGATAVFMIEDEQLVAGGAIPSGVATIDCTEDEGNKHAAIAVTCNRSDVLELLVRDYSRLVYRIAYAALRSHHDAEDATQETFVRVLRYGSRLGEVQDPKTWLARIAWRVAVDRSRRRGSSRETSLENSESLVHEVTSSDIPADETVHGSQFRTALEKMIAALPEKLRQPLILSTIQEMSPQEVAATLGMSEAAVRSRVFRARQILKEKLAQQMNRK